MAPLLESGWDCCEETQSAQRGHMRMGRPTALAKPCPQVILTQAPGLRVKELLDDSSPQPLSHPLAIRVPSGETLHIMEQHQTTPALPRLGF